MYIERFKAWQLVRLRGRGPYKGSAWRAAAHIYRDRAINCMEAMRSYQESIHVWEDAYTQLEEKHADELRAAIEAEQESCAQVLDTQADAIDAAPGESVTATWVARILRDQARAIRARKEE